jgi:hypothetical protein
LNEESGDLANASQKHDGTGVGHHFGDVDIDEVITILLKQ